MKKVKLYNTLGRELQEFEPITSGKAGMYTCGPTVYNYAHIGNLRTYVFEDVLRRALEYSGFQVEHVMNVTDVGHLTDDADQGEDKILVTAREKKMGVYEIAEHYTQAFFDDLRLLNIQSPTIVCKATEHIADMIELIRRLEDNGYTYVSGGNVYFDIGRFPDYGRLALLRMDELQAGSRIEVDRNKKHPMDFVLWFTQSKFDHQAMLWNSPWGTGYPGWHIECSAMSMKYLGESIDIHCGGVDHIPVHHTNEIAQTEGATGKKWVNYWIHGGYLCKDEKKMAKSSGGFLTLKELMDCGYDPMDYRYYLLGAHYRSQLSFGFEGIDAAKTARERLLERVSGIKRSVGLSGAGDGAFTAAASTAAAPYLESFERNALTDMNMPRCLADLWNLLRDGQVDDVSKLSALLKMDRIFGLNIQETPAEPPELDEEAGRLLSEREAARASGDYTRADEIRDALKERGILLEDTAEGVRWRRTRAGG